MGWFWNKTPPSSSSDPLRDLDPSLRDFLSKESPVKYNPAPAPSPPKALPKTTPTPSPPEPQPSQTSPVPPESLYPDGRYAHLWSTYRPLSAIENESKSDQEKLTDVLDGYKARKAQIGRAAVENCVFEQIELDECYTNGGVAARMTMCRKQAREFERCYTMQSRFLKALGYLSTYDRPPDIDEQIQMHADTLYHRMLAQEQATEAAKTAGQPAPTFAPILSPETTPTPPAPSTSSSSTADLAANSSIASTNPTTMSQKDTLPPLSPTTQKLLNANSQQKLRERLKDMSPYERELEERSVQMEARTAGEIAAHMKDVEEGRKKRREEGKGTAADTVAGWFGW